MKDAKNHHEIQSYYSPKGCKFIWATLYVMCHNFTLVIEPLSGRGIRQSVWDGFASLRIGWLFGAKFYCRYYLLSRCSFTICNFHRIYTSYVCHVRWTHAFDLWHFVVQRCSGRSCSKSDTPMLCLNLQRKRGKRKWASTK